VNAAVKMNEAEGRREERRKGIGALQAIG